MKEETIDPRDYIEFHLGHSESTKHYQMVLASTIDMNTELVLLALETFIEETRRNKTDLFNMGDEFLLVEN